MVRPTFARGEGRHIAGIGQDQAARLVDFGAWGVERVLRDGPHCICTATAGTLHRGLSARTIVSAGSSVLLLDYRGYGKSEGSRPRRTLSGCRDRVRLDRRARVTPKQIVIHGESLGTAVATWLATNRPSAGVILEAPFTSAKAVAGRVVPFLVRCSSTDTTA